MTKHFNPMQPDLPDLPDEAYVNDPLPQPNVASYKQEQAAIANDLDHTPLTFGKYKGMTPNQVAEIDPSWVVWAYNNVTNRNTCSRLLANECERASGKRK